MADFSEINQEINEQINTNGQRAITGAKLNEVLRDMISSVDENKMDVVEIDTVPTEGSTNPVESGGVYEALQGKVNEIKVMGIRNLTSEQVYSLRAGDVVVDTLKKTKKAYTVSIQNAGTIDLVSVSDGTITVCRYRSGEYQDTVNIDITQKASEFTEGNVVSFDENGNLYDSGIASSEVATQSDLSGFITNTVNNLTNYYLKSETYTQAEVNALIGAIQQFHYEIYATLPQTGQSNVLYLIGPTGSGSDRYEEYVYSNNAFIKIGDTSIDLSGYVTTSALNTALADYTTTENLTTLLSNKADKVSNANNGNFAGLDSNGNLTDSGYSSSDFLKTVVNTTYSELVTLKNNGNLVSGAQYRITDYSCTTTQTYTQSAGHVFDIIVTADSETELNENARAAHHTGDTYFVNCNIEAWELKYCLDNDTNRFAWASNAQIYNSSNIERIKVPYDELLNELKLLIVSEGLDYSDDDCAFYFDESMHSGNRAYYFSHDGGASLNLDFGVFLKGNTEYSIGNTVVMESQIGQGDPINVTLSEINNDTNVNGKGVIYYMKDEWNNECPYDFKNVMFKRWAVTEVTDSVLNQDTVDALNEVFVFDGNNRRFQARFSYQENNCTYGSTTHVVDAEDSGWYYTFSIIMNDVDSGEFAIDNIEDGSIKGNNFYNDEGGGGFYGNTIKPRYDNMASDGDGIDGAQVLNNIVLNGYYENSDENPYIYGCNNNSFGGNCYDNTFGNGCYQNSFGNDYYDNTFGNGCNSNLFGNNCFQNSFGNYFQSNSFGNNCVRNSFGNSCYWNSFGNSCSRNTFGNDCQYNSFGNDCGGNSFGNDCQNNSFGNDCQYNSFGNYCQTITVFDGVQNCNVTGGTNSLQVKNAQILNGTKGTSAFNKLTITFTPNQNYTQIAGLVDGTNLRIWIAENTVTGPQTSTNNHIAVFNGVTGKIVKDSGYATSDFATAAQGALADTAYQKPLTGIPASDLASGVIPDVSGKEDTSNKVTSFQTTPDDTHYPSEKLVKDYVDGICGDIQTILISI